MFSSTCSLMRGFLCRKQTCTVTVIHYWTDRRPSVDRTSYTSHRWIARYWLTIAICAYPPAFDAAVRGGGPRWNIAMAYGKTRMIWLHGGEKNWRYDYSFWQNSRMWQTDGQTDTAWRHRPRLHIIACQQWFRLFCVTWLWDLTLSLLWLLL